MSWLFSFEAHFVLEAVALGVVMYLGGLGFGLMKHQRGRIECRALFGFGLVVSIVKTVHLLLPTVTNGQGDLFVPISWLTEKLIALPILFLFAAKRLNNAAVGSLALLGGVAVAFGWLSSHSSYYEVTLPVGRPEEFLVVVGALFTMWRLLRRRYGLQENDASSVFLIPTLLLMAASSFVMAFSQELYDAPCILAHFLQLASYAPLCGLARKLTS